MTIGFGPMIITNAVNAEALYVGEHVGIDVEAAHERGGVCDTSDLHEVCEVVLELVSALAQEFFALVAEDLLWWECHQETAVAEKAADLIVELLKS